MVSKTRVGGEKDPKLDLIRSLDPDLVIANIEENLPEHVEALRSWGIPVYVAYPRTVWQGIQLIGELGFMTGAERRALDLTNALEAQYHETAALTKARQPAVRVFCPIWRMPYMTINRDTYVHDMIKCSGGENVFADREARYPKITLEEMAARRPEVILLPDEPYHFRKPHLADFEPYRETPALLHGRVHFVNGKLLSWYGPRIAEALQTLPALLGR